MTTPKDNTEVIRMLRDVKNSIWKSLTPMKVFDQNYNEYISSLTNSVGCSSHINLPNIATKLNFSGLEDLQTSTDSIAFHGIETPGSLKRKLMITEAELQSSKAKVKEREAVISVMEPANKKMCITLENKLEQCRKQSELDAQLIEELQGQVRWAKKQYTSAKQRLHEVEHEKRLDVDQKGRRILALQQECSNLKIDLANVQSEKTEATRKLNMELGRLELKISMLSEEAEKSQEYIQSLKRQNSEMAEKVALCNSYQNELNDALAKINMLENKIEAEKDAALIIASRQNDLESLTELQKENEILNEEVSKYKESNVMLYQEKMWSMQEKLTHAEKKCINLAKLQIENETLKTKITQWEELFDDESAPFKSPSAFSRKLSQYQRNEAILTNKLAHLAAHCDILEKQKIDQEEKIKSLNQQLLQHQLRSSHHDSLLKRFQRKIVFLTKEKENNRKLLDSYLSETTLSGNMLNEEHMHHLESMNEEYKKTLEKYETEIDVLNEKIEKLIENKGDASEQSEEGKHLKDENASLLAQITQLQKEKDELQVKCSSLESAQKEKPTPSDPGRVLHLRFNPLEAANRRHLENFHKLQEENDQLKKRIKVLEEEGLGASDVTMKVREKLVSEGADSTLQGLKDKLASAERQKRFILENAKIKSTEFREAVYRLTGYRIDMRMNDTYKLSHLYADSRDDYLLFKINSEGVQLIETEYSKQVSNRMELYLHQHDSFPAFLSSLTLDLFNQQTFMIEPGQ